MTLRSTLFAATLVVALGLSAPVAAQDKKIFFTGPTPPAEVTIDPAQPVRIGIDGNVTARCRLDANGRCVQTGFGSGGIGPTVSLAADQFSNPPDAQQRYPAGTTFRITPTVGATAEVCRRFVQPERLTTGTNWAGLIVAPFAASTVTLPAANETYSFGLRCFGEGGATNSPLLTYATSDAAPPPPTGQCTPAELAAAEASRPGFEDSVLVPGTVVPQPGIPGPAVAATLFPSLLTVPNGTNCPEFPLFGSSFCLIHADANRFVSIQFRVPTSGFPPAQQLRFLEAETPSFNASPSAPGRWYLSISRCPGDFRAPASGTPPVGDPTLSYGCRNVRPNAISGVLESQLFLKYRIDGPSDGDTCGLVPGQVYFLNFVNADIRDGGGITANEYTCPPSAPGYCGVMFRN